jgi:hypothetical protein
LAAWHLNTAYDLGSLYFKRYHPKIVEEKKFLGCLTLVIDSTLYVQTYGPTLYKSATEYVERYQRIKAQEQEQQIWRENERIKAEAREYVRCQNILEGLQNNPLTRACAKFCTDNCGGHGRIEWPSGQ